MPLAWRQEPISEHHACGRFNCGTAELNHYLANHARTNHDAGASLTFVLVPPAEPEKVLGYYTVCPSSVELTAVPKGHRYGRYPQPGYRLARLAVDQTFQGEGIGSRMFFLACRRVLQASREIGGHLLVIDAKDDRAADFYRRLGAESLPETPLLLVLPLTTISTTISQVTGR